MDAQQQPQTAEQVAVWFVNGEPARLVVDGRRWRVMSSSITPHRGEPSYIPPMLTHAPTQAVIRYTFTAVSVDEVQHQRFTIRAEGDRWVLG